MTAKSDFAIFNFCLWGGMGNPGSLYHPFIRSSVVVVPVPHANASILSMVVFHSDNQHICLMMFSTE